MTAAGCIGFAVYVAETPIIVRSTVAREGVDAIDACAFASTRISSTVTDVNITRLPLKADGTLADVASNTIGANTIVLAWLGRALVDICSAFQATEAAHTRAAVSSHTVSAYAPVLAGKGCAIVDIDLACRASETVCTSALEGVHPVSTLALIVARHCCTVIDVDFTAYATEPGGTYTRGLPFIIMPVAAALLSLIRCFACAGIGSVVPVDIWSRRCRWWMRATTAAVAAMIGATNSAVVPL